MSNPSSSKSPLLYGLLACSLGLNLVLLLRGGPSGEVVETVSIEELGEDIDAGEPADGVGTAAAVATPGSAATAPTAEAASGGQWTTLHAKVDQSLARTFQLAAGESGDALSSVFARIYVWDLDLRRDLQAGDALAVNWRIGSDGFPEIAAASLKTQKLGRTLAAYRWQVPGDSYPSYWQLDGTEAPLRLKDGPLAQYEQITSLLKDRPTHKGMDFKTPVGTEVTSPRAGTVTRVNWNWGSNGNCIEIRNNDGVLAKYLHLSENKVAAGDKVSAGQLIALTGNTGHSTAPHLHYQLDQGPKVLDPLNYHGTERRKLTPEQIAALKAEVVGLESELGANAGQ